MMARARSARPSTIALLVLGVAACDATPPPVGMERGTALFDTCAACHGATAAGNPDIAAPAIAGLPQWYIEEQLHGFQQGFRGLHARDIPGLRMRPMAVTLNRPGDIESVAEYVASLPPVYPASTLRGNAGAGAGTYTVCVTCHGADGLGNRDLHAPPIVQLDDWYLLSQLRNFKSGARGGRPGDTWGATMRPNTLVLDDQAMQNVIAYVQTLR
jgi:cytochrome c553